MNSEVQKKIRLVAGDRCRLVNLPEGLLDLPEEVDLVNGRSKASNILCFAESYFDIPKVLENSAKHLCSQVHLTLIFPKSLNVPLGQLNTAFDQLVDKGFRRITSFNIDTRHKAIRFYYSKSLGESRKIDVDELKERSNNIRNRYQSAVQ